jgi:hypothetical protein
MNTSLVQGIVENVGGYVFFGLIFFFLVVFITRELACWYFKINRINTLLEQIEENTRPKGLTRESLNKSD